MHTTHESWTLQLEVSGIPESSGLRIRSKNPFGLYIFIRHEEVAKSVCEDYIAELLMQQDIFPEEALAIGLAEPIDWDALIANGGGSVTFRIYEEDEEVPGSEMEIEEIPEEMFHEHNVILDNGRILYVLVSDNKLDQWIQDSIASDIHRNSMN